MDVAILEQETFVVRLGIISLIKLSPKVAGWEHLALLFARHSVFGIKVEHVHNVVQFSATSVVFRGTIINWGIIRTWKIRTIIDYHRLSQTIKDYQRISKNIKEYRRISGTIEEYQGISKTNFTRSDSKRIWTCWDHIFMTPTTHQMCKQRISGLFGERKQEEGNCKLSMLTL